MRVTLPNEIVEVVLFWVSSAPPSPTSLEIPLNPPVFILSVPEEMFTVLSEIVLLTVTSP